MKLGIVFLAFFALLASAAAQQATPVCACEANPSQHAHDMALMDMPDHASHEGMAHGGMQMDMALQPVAQPASGTSWQPASTPAHMWMGAFRGWTFMAHGNLFVGYNQQGGPQGVGKFESENWLMLMEDHAVGRAKLQLRQMLSAEPVTTPHPGFPELFQTGETYKGQPLVNHQHPHNAFGEISAQLTVPITGKFSWLVYGGPAAEPALGPVAFLHRASAQENPAAPLGHHLQDSTHISYGVVTSGFTYGKVRAEASAFNGREPDERRYNIGLGPLDSWAARLSVAPTENWTVQYSYGRLTHPEALEPGNINRQTASIQYNRRIPAGNWANTLLWGHNFKQLERTTQNSYLYESALNFARRNYAYTRLELVDKDELFAGNVPLPASRIGAYTFGGVRDIGQSALGQVGLGADVTFYSMPSTLNAVYGHNPVSFHVFLRLRPPLAKH